MLSQRSRFFALPIELRILVYNELLLPKPYKGLSILRVCRQIYAEAQPILFKRPLTFHSHEALYDWIRGIEPDNLERVSSVSITLLSFCHNPMPPFEFYKKDQPRLQTTLSLLPNVQRFSIYKGFQYLHPLAYDYLNTFFPWFADLYPNLRGLTLFIDCIPLDFLLQMRFLRSLRFTGYSTSTQTAIEVVFQSLKHLEELEVFGPPPDMPYRPLPMVHPVGSIVSSMTPEYVLALTPSLLLSIRPLKSFTICEIRPPSRSPPLFLTVDLLAALHSAHGHSLKTLTISADFTPAPATRLALSQLFQDPRTTSLINLSLGWPGLEILTLDTLPPSLRDLQISCDAALLPDEAAKKLIAQLHLLPGLSHVTLRTDWRTRFVPMDTDWWTCTYGESPLHGETALHLRGGIGHDWEERMQEGVARLRSCGVRAERGWWHPICFEELSEEQEEEDRKRKAEEEAKGKGKGKGKGKERELRPNVEQELRFIPYSV